MRQTSCVVYLAIDDLLDARGTAIAGLDEFSATLDHAGIPCVWLTNQTRLQVDALRRSLHHTHPFISEDGCGVFLPEDYFHLRPQGSGRQPASVTTVRLGRFTCLPVAQQQPAAADMLDALAAETGVSVVPLRSLSPRELAQNSGLPPKQAEFARQRDFDELFFFAGATPKQLENFHAAARAANVQLRPRGNLWSLAIGSSLPGCVKELSKLYDRALHAHARAIGIAAARNEKAISAACDRAVMLTEKDADEIVEGRRATKGRRVMELPLHSSDMWERLTSYLTDQK